MSQARPRQSRGRRFDPVDQIDWRTPEAWAEGSGAVKTGLKIPSGDKREAWMALWDKFLKRRDKLSLAGQEYRVHFSLYSEDGKRAADVCEFRDGKIYLAEREWVEGTMFKDRHAGRLVGPFASREEAEKFIVTTSWFCGRGG